MGTPSPIEVRAAGFRPGPGGERLESLTSACSSSRAELKSPRGRQHAPAASARPGGTLATTPGAADEAPVREAPLAHHGGIDRHPVSAPDADRFWTTDPKR